jgi:hypothetical protein
MAGMALSAMSAISGAVAARQQSQARQDQANYQAAVQRNNAIIARQDAEAIRKRTAVKEADRKLLGEGTISGARAQQASQGFLVDDASVGATNTSLLADIREQTAIDVARIKDQGDLDIRATLIGASNSEAQAGLLDLKADQENPGLAGGATLLAGAAKTISVGKSLGAFKG